MKKSVYILAAIVMAALMLFTACGSSAADEDDAVIARVGETTVTVREYKEYMEMVMYYYLNVDSFVGQDAETVEAIKADVLDVLILDAAHKEMARIEGYYEFTPAQQEELDYAMETEKEPYLEEVRAIVAEENPSLTGEAFDKKVEEEFEKYLEENDIDLDYIYKTYRDYFAQQYFYDDLVQGVTVSDADIEAEYELRLEEHKELYSDQATFESVSDTYGMCYIPENARRVKHILIMIPEEYSAEAEAAGSIDEYNEIIADGHEAIYEEAMGVLGMINDDGSNFDDIMVQYTEDPGLASNPDGYFVMAGDETIWVQSFADAALALEKEGDITGLVYTDYGYHIIRLEEILTPGPVALEYVRDSIEEELLFEAQEAYFMEQREKWKTDLGYEIDEKGMAIIDRLYSVED